MPPVKGVGVSGFATTCYKGSKGVGRRGVLVRPDPKDIGRIRQFKLNDGQSPAVLEIEQPAFVRLKFKNISDGLSNTIAAADFDLDGDVDREDLVRWQTDFGGPGSDADGDGDSDGGDFLAWQRQIGGGQSTFATSQTVPEPSTMTLLTGVLLTGALLRGVLSRALAAPGTMTRQERNRRSPLAGKQLRTLHKRARCRN